MSVKSKKIRIEIVGRDGFWTNAVLVEWEHQHPQRKLISDSGSSYLIEDDWLDDLRRVAGDCYSKVVVSPLNPNRRVWLHQFLKPGK
jgi:hypothetical protein